jgi:hypothetical protein
MGNFTSRLDENRCARGLNSTDSKPTRASKLLDVCHSIDRSEPRLQRTRFVIIGSILLE